MKLRERLAAALKKLTGRSAAAVLKGTAGQSADRGPRAKKTAAPKTSGETAPKSAAKMPEGSVAKRPSSAAGIPKGTAQTTATATSAVPKGTAEAVPGRMKTAQPKGSTQMAPEKPGAAMPAGSAQTVPRSVGPRQRPSGGGGFSVLTEEVALTGPPVDQARHLSELLRVQRRMNPGAETYGEEVL